MSYNTGRSTFRWIVKSQNKYCRAVCRPTSPRLAFGLSHDTTRRAACCGLTRPRAVACAL